MGEGIKIVTNQVVKFQCLGLLKYFCLHKTESVSSVPVQILPYEIPIPVSLSGQKLESSDLHTGHSFSEESTSALTFSSKATSIDSDRNGWLSTQKRNSSLVIIKSSFSACMFVCVSLYMFKCVNTHVCGCRIMKECVKVKEKTFGVFITCSLGYIVNWDLWLEHRHLLLCSVASQIALGISSLHLPYAGIRDVLQQSLAIYISGGDTNPVLIFVWVIRLPGESPLSLPYAPW